MDPAGAFLERGRPWEPLPRLSFERLFGHALEARESAPASRAV